MGLSSISETPVDIWQTAKYLQVFLRTIGQLMVLLHDRPALLVVWPGGFAIAT